MPFTYPCLVLLISSIWLCLSYVTLINQQPSKWNASLCPVSCSRKLSEPEEGVLRTSIYSQWVRSTENNLAFEVQEGICWNLQYIAGQPEAHVITWVCECNLKSVGGSLCRTEPLTYGMDAIFHSVRTELDCRTHSLSVRAIFTGVGEPPHRLKSRTRSQIRYLPLPLISMFYRVHQHYLIHSFIH